jgi:hypothetical protein
LSGLGFGTNDFWPAADLAVVTRKDESIMTGSLKTITRALLAASFVFVATAAFAQQPKGAGPDEGHSGCTHVFTKGGGATFIHYCTNIHGNLNRFQSPLGHEHIEQGTFADGYAICSSTFGVHGYDYADVGESAWGAAVILVAPTATGVTYARTTADGRIRVEHGFKLDSVEDDVTITVKVINLSPGPIAGVQYKRMSDFDVSGFFGSNLWTRTADEVSAIEPATLRGISMNAITFGTSHSTSIVPFIGAFTNCTTPASEPQADIGDNEANVVYNLGTINPLKSKTVKIVYKRQ